MADLIIEVKSWLVIMSLFLLTADLFDRDGWVAPQLTYNYKFIKFIF